MHRHSPDNELHRRWSDQRNGVYVHGHGDQHRRYIGAIGPICCGHATGEPTESAGRKHSINIAQPWRHRGESRRCTNGAGPAVDRDGRPRGSLARRRPRLSTSAHWRQSTGERSHHRAVCDATAGHLFRSGKCNPSAVLTRGDLQPAQNPLRRMPPPSHGRPPDPPCLVHSFYEP